MNWAALIAFFVADAIVVGVIVATILRRRR